LGRPYFRQATWYETMKDLVCQECASPLDEDVVPPEPFFLTGRDARRNRLSAERAAERRAEIAHAISAGMLSAPE